MAITCNRRVLLLGGSGMLGHKLSAKFASALDIKLILTQRSSQGAPLYLDAANTTVEKIAALLRDVAPDYAINCIGVLKSNIASNDCRSLVGAIDVNSRFPHLLAVAAEDLGTRIIHISTDGVFSGLKNGAYLESDPADAIDDYGRTKSLGECRQGHVLNVRCSIVGRDPRHGRGLLEQLLRTPDGEQINGYVDQDWNGVTNKQVSDFCLSFIRDDLFGAARLEGPIIHLCPNPTISKYDLLSLWREVTGKNVVVQRVKRPNATANRILASKCNSWRKAVHPITSWSELLRNCIQDPSIA